MGELFWFWEQPGMMSGSSSAVTAAASTISPTVPADRAIRSSFPKTKSIPGPFSCFGDCSRRMGGCQSTLWSHRAPRPARAGACGPADGSRAARTNSFVRGASNRPAHANPHRQTGWERSTFLSSGRYRVARVPKRDTSRLGSPASRPKALGMAFFPLERSHPQAALEAATHHGTQDLQNVGRTQRV